MDTVKTWPTFPSEYYFNADRYQQELETIWYNNWLYLCRADTIEQAQTYRTFSIGNQNIIVLRDEHGAIQAFHNTCRHRGSILCTEASGELKTRLVCPYHAWSYSLQGELKGVPFIGSAEKLGQENLSLYSVHVREWGGCIFVNLAEDGAEPFEAHFDPHIDALNNWPLADTKVGYTLDIELKCNYKLFWENFQECYHCPGIHPELCDMVPLYKRAVSGRAAARQLASLTGNTAADIPKTGMREDASTWSMNGEITGKPFHNLSEEELRLGYKYVVGLPNWFMAAHPDYIRLVSLFPTGPETMQLKSEWLFPQETLDHPDFDLMNAVNFGKLVLEQDGAVCELNQRGLRSNRHTQGLLMPQEEDVHQFLQWIRAQMGEPLEEAITDVPDGWEDY